VLGVEGVPFVVEQFFRENKLEHDKISMPEINGWRFRVSVKFFTSFNNDSIPN
jgi:hypothetical protein